MGFYDAMKDAINMAQKADNIELYRQLLDLGAQALELQAEVARLREENQQLREKANLESRIIRHRVPYITLKDDTDEIVYCSNCWDSNRVLVQMLVYQSYGYDTFRCHTCKSHFSK